jgi:hypothetical protein
MSLLDKASLIVTPNAYKESKLYSVVPSSGAGDMDVVRATTATRVNSSGLIEQVPYNLLTYSEQFDNSDWGKYQATILTNSTIAPNGNTTADTLQTSTNGSAVLYKDSFLSIGNNTLSIYAKKGNNDIIDIGFFDVTEFTARFNLTSGTLVSQTTGLNSTIESVGNDWYRLAITKNITSVGGVFIINITSTINKTIYIWGAQLEAFPTATEYFPTTTRLNIPRIDYTNGSCPSLLVEPQRTNLLTYSEDFSNAVYTKIETTINTNTSISPSGIQNADSILEVASNESHQNWQRVSMTSGQSYTQSCYFKANGRNRVIMQIFDNATQYANAIFDLSSGVVVGSFGTATIQNMSNGWYRCKITGTSPATGLGYCVIGLCENTYSTPSIVPTYLGDITKGVYAWGFQVEAGSYPTSYIPTVASTVTRNADVISKTGISSLIGQTEGTLFFDLKTIANNEFKRLAISGGSFLNSIFFDFDNTNNLYVKVFNGGSPVATLLASGVNIANRNKIAIAYKNSDFSFYVNGSQVASQASGAVPSGLSVFEFSLGGNEKFEGNINTSALWKERLTNTELAQLTTL